MGSSPAGTVKSSVAQLAERLKMGSVNFTGNARVGAACGDVFPPDGFGEQGEKQYEFC